MRTRRNTDVHYPCQDAYWGRSWLRAKPPTPVSPSHRSLFQDFQHRVEAQNVRVNSEPGNHSFGHIGQDAVDVALGNTADVHLHVW
jgi:hypothetical protein